MQGKEKTIIEGRRRSNQEVRQSAVLHVSGSACLTATPQIAAMHVAGNAGYNQFTITLYW